jgi:5,10-methylenetetrahydromethanopterin reductase
VRPIPELVELVVAAEARGAAAILVADEGTDRDLYVTLTALAGATRTTLLMAAVTNPFSRHPVTSAAAFASLSELAPGRIVAGFGAGGSRVLHPMAIAAERPFSALRDAIDIAEGLWSGRVVDHEGAITTRAASLPWAGGPLPVAIAGRGPRVEALAAQRADWVLLAGKSLAGVEALVGRLRAGGIAARGRPPAVAWNPLAAWTDALVAEARSHLAYMAVDLPAAERRGLGVDDDLAARLRHVVTTEGPEAAGPLVPASVVDHYAITGDPATVALRLGALREQLAPELLVFDAGDYTAGFMEEVAGMANSAGARDGPLGT